MAFTVLLCIARLKMNTNVAETMTSGAEWNSPEYRAFSRADYVLHKDRIVHPSI